MIYVMSDIHGCYQKYLAMLKMIHFSPHDTLYLIGDVIDRGEEGIDLLLDILGRKNVHLLMGNHEYVMSVLLSNAKIPLERTSVISQELRQGLEIWLEDGGWPTFQTYLKLSAETKLTLKRFLFQLPLFAQITIGKQEFILVHSGFGRYNPCRTLQSYSPGELLFERSNLKYSWYLPKTVIVGHTPTFDYSRQYIGKMMKINNVIDIDCGCSYPESGVLGCLRLDDGEEFYVE